MRICTVTLVFMLIITGTSAAAQVPCAAGADALGTERVLTLDAETTPQVGRKSFPQTLPLAPKEVVLTFDDGPRTITTPKILDTLKTECVRATFFLVGQNAIAHQDLARREIAEGHTVAYHTFSHPLLNRIPLAAAKAEIDRGFSSVDTALYGKEIEPPITRFFRFPGFASSAVLLDDLQRRGIIVFGADLWADDWVPQSPNQQLQLVLRRIKAASSGIVLFHDTKLQIAAMLPMLLRALKGSGYRIVHVIPRHSTSTLSVP
jgi:peptidoglycan-N-acetylglucosamine deacetylase